MTSKISFSKLVKRTIKEETSLIFASCVYAVIGVMMTVFELQHLFAMGFPLEGADAVPKEVFIANLFAPGQGVTGLSFSILLAALFAFASLRHLHSKTQSDFYGSLPIKRRTQLSVILVSCLLIYVVPLVLQYLVNILAVTMTGNMTLLALKYMVVNVLLQILIFLLTWFTAALAVILTGHIFIGLLGFAVFCGYFPVVLKYLVPTFEDMYFATYADVYSSVESGILSLLNYLSPVFLAVKMINYDQGYDWSLAANGLTILVALVEGVLLALLVYYLYNKRPSEAAGSSMTFPAWNTFWAILFIVPAALYTGILFTSIAYGSGTRGWIFPGTVIGLVIFAVLIEFLFDFDIKAVLSHKRRFAACAVICMAFLAVFQFDLFGFDNWKPAKDQVEKITFDYNGMSFKSSDAMGRYVSNRPLISEIAARKGIFGEDLDAAYELAMTYADQGNILGENFGSEYDEADNTFRQHVVVRYTMKNGRVKTRSYFVEVRPDDPLLKEVVEKESFKDDIYIHYALAPDMVTKAEWYNGFEFTVLNWTEDETAEFIEAYKMDLANLTTEEMLTENPVSTVKLSIVDSDVYDSYIYRSFDNSIAYLKKYGVDATYAGFTAEDTTMLVFQGYYDEDSAVNIQKTITDKKQIEELIPYLTSMDFEMVSIPAYSNIDYNFSVEIHTQNGILYSQITEKGVDLLKTL
ncbi:MAG: DUF6449 domain-containing protein [Dorea sp.]|nr:DUF6449 domain-containing protein [Dorea sp.]